jgi:hypothetical protein
MTEIREECADAPAWRRAQWPVGSVGRRDPAHRTDNASSQALAARRVEVRDANTTVELR